MVFMAKPEAHCNLFRVHCMFSHLCTLQMSRVTLQEARVLSSNLPKEALYTTPTTGLLVKRIGACQSPKKTSELKTLFSCSSFCILTFLVFRNTCLTCLDFDTFLHFHTVVRICVLLVISCSWCRAPPTAFFSMASMHKCHLHMHIMYNVW